MKPIKHITHFSTVMMSLFFSCVNTSFANPGNGFGLQGANNNNSVINSTLGGAYLIENEMFLKIAAYYSEHNVLPAKNSFRQTFSGSSAICKITNDDEGGVLLQFCSSNNQLSGKQIRVLPHKVGNQITFGSSLCVTDISNQGDSYQFLNPLPSYTPSIAISGSNSGFGQCYSVPKAALKSSTYSQLSASIKAAIALYTTSDSSSSTTDASGDSTITNNFQTVH